VDFKPNDTEKKEHTYWEKKKNINQTFTQSPNINFSNRNRGILLHPYNNGKPKMLQIAIIKLKQIKT